ncbi:MAG: hypothetical protein IJZ57_01345 [Clostridia bacterium]|nr:hypothetical protein [Clostridia bacterium]
MKKKILSVIISICLILTAVQPIADIFAASAVWGGGTSVPSLTNGFYQISSGEELAWFAQQVNSGSNTIKGKLTDNIVMNEQYSTANNFTPIGTVDYPFAGEFDGGGFTISNLYIETTSDYVGLFGYVAGERPDVDDKDDSTEEVFKANPLNMIYNVHLSSASITGNQNVGGIAGFISYGVITDCSFNGELTATANSAGGIAGYIYDYAKVQRSVTHGTIQGVIRAGGICGYGNSNSTVLKCYSTADVFSNANVNGNAGGIVGTVSASTVNGCYFLGRVYGPKKVGGIVGTNSYSTLLGCYTLAPVYTTILNNTDYIAAIAGYSLGGSYYNCYYNEATSLWVDDNATARTLEQMKKFSFARELNENGNAFTYDYMELNNGYPVLAWTLETAVWAGGKEEPQKDSAGYYLITTADELAWFSGLVNGTLAGVDQNTSANAKVTENILLNIFIVENSDETNVWTPIGTAESPFNGIFIGNHFNIAGVYTNGASYQGLFGNVGANANVSNVVMLDCLITGTDYVGGIAGYNKGIISTSGNDSTVRGERYVGGITGYNSGTVTVSYNVGTVECTSASGAHIGGVVGSNQRGKVQQCFNNGLVQGAAGNYFGGVCGSSTGDGIHNCYNSGSINGGYYIGGIAGYINTATITNCYNRGYVNSQNSMGTNTGNFIGFVNGTCTLTNCYYDTTIENSVMTNTTDAVGLDTTGLTGSGIATALGFQSGYWTSKASNSYFDYYPQITALATANCEKMKADSLESAKIVQKQYMLHIKIDGKEDSYYKTFDDALTAIGTKKGYIIPIRNLVLNETITIANNISIYGLDFNRTLTRNPSFTGVMFDVTGTLTLGDIKNGNDENALLTIDGNGGNVTAASPVINVASGATLNTYPGFTVTNAVSSTVGSVIYNEGTANINGGVLKANQTTCDAGTIYNNMGTINMTAGTVDSSSSVTKGGAVYNNYGIMNISGGTFSNNYAKTLGGAIYSIGADAVVTISGTANFTANSAKAGGAFYVNSGTLVMNGGTVSNNFAYNTRGNTATAGGGGAATVNTNGTFTMKGGIVDSNYVYTETGTGYGFVVYGKMQMGGSAAVTNNDIYLAKNKTVEITDGLTASGTALTITPYTYTAGTYVLSGTGMGLSYTKVEITPDGTSTEWNVNSSGYLMNTAISNVASLSKFGAYSVEYVSLAEAVSNIGAGEEGIITIIADNTISETIKIYGDVTILSETDQVFTSRRSGSFTGALFEVQSGGTLRLGYSSVEVEGSADMTPSEDEESEVSADSVGGEYHLDGGNNYYGATGTSSIKVLKGGTLYTYDDFYLEYGYSTEGTISVLGEMYMFGGTIKNNLATSGAAINISTGGYAYLYGGAITNNQISGTGLGKAIYCAGNLIRAAHSYVYYQNDVEVARQNTFTTITSDNDVYMASGKKITLSNVESKVLLSETAEIPTTEEVTATPISVTYPSYYVGMVVLKGTDVALHYTSFDITTPGYCIESDGTIGVNLLVPASSSSYVVTRGNLNYVSGINTSLNLVGYVINQFANTDKIEIVGTDGKVLSSGDIVTTGCVVNLYNADETAVVDSIYIVIYGDVDCDGKIDGMDSMLMSCYVAGSLTSSDLTPAQIEAGDIDNTSSVNSTDIAYVQKCGAMLQTVQQY